MLCQNCKEKESLPGKKRFCQDCNATYPERFKQEQRERWQREKQRRNEAGLCSTCGKNPKTETFRQCQSCRDRAAKEQAEIRRRRAKANLCSRCGKNPASPGSMCKPCRTSSTKQVIANKKARNALLKAQGLCTECKQPNNVPEFLTCPNCRKKRQDREAKKRLSTPRYAALVRDDFTCQLCSHNKGLHVHHINGNPDNNNLDNLLTLCSRCHHAVTVLRTNQPELAANLVLAGF